MKKLLLLTTTLSAFALQACATTDMNDDMMVAPAALADGEANPAMWVMKDEDTTIYFLGTFHLLPEDMEWRSGTIDSAIASSDELYLEVAADLSDQAAMLPIVQDLGIDTSNPPIMERLSAEDAAKAKVLFDNLGVPMAAMNPLDTWFVNLTLVGLRSQKMGMMGEAGVDMVVRKAFTDAGKPIKGLETVREQLGYFDTMSEEGQRDMLAQSLVSDAEFEEQMEGMTQAWRTGNTQSIADSFNDGMEVGTELREALLTRRNAAWTVQLDDRMDQPGTALVAVGAGHLVGPDSVIAMLRARGFKISRINR